MCCLIAWAQGVRGVGCAKAFDGTSSLPGIRHSIRRYMFFSASYAFSMKLEMVCSNSFPGLFF